jgi:hypothetical protein
VAKTPQQRLQDQRAEIREIAQKVGRPKVGSYRLETIVTHDVLEELMREEAASGLYRTRVAANVLCNWAKQQRGA